MNRHPVVSLRARTLSLLVAVAGCHHSPAAVQADAQPATQEIRMDSKKSDVVLAQLESSEATLRGPAPEPVYAKLDAEKAELDAALGWFKANDHAKGLRAAGLLSGWWTAKGLIPDGTTWLTTFLGFPENQGKTLPRAKALVALGYLQFRQGETAKSKEALQEALAIAQAVGAKAVAGDAWMSLGRCALREEDLPRAFEVAKQAKQAYLDAGDEDQLVLPTHVMAEATRMQGDYAGAEKLYLDSLKIATAAANKKMIAVENNNLAAVAIHDEKWTDAERYAREGTRVGYEIGSTYVVPYGLVAAGEVAVGQGNWSRAATLLAGADALFKSSGSLIDPADQKGYDAAVAKLKAAYDAKKLDADWKAGAAMSMDQLVAFTLGK